MSNSFERAQDNYFARFCEKRYRWQTENPFISQAERELLKYLPTVPGTKVLELGCGTGSNLFNLRAIGKIFEFTGLDINAEEICLAQHKFPTAQFICGDGTNVRLPDESFDLVFCRDVIHHIEPSQQLKLIKEMTRLTKVGGQIVVIESNGLNFVVWAFGKLVKAERYVLQSTPKRITRLIQQVENLDTSALVPKFVEPWNFFRFILHYHFGLPWLAQRQLICGFLIKMNHLAAKILPPHRWAYMIFTTVRRY